MKRERITRENKRVNDARVREKLNGMGINAYVKLKNAQTKFWEDERGMGVIEIALIIVILIGLALLFKKEISTLLNSILSKMNIEAFNF